MSPPVGAPVVLCMHGWPQNHREILPVIEDFADHCFDCAKAIAVSAEGGVIEQCGHWVFEEKTDFIREQLGAFWAKHG